MRSNTGKIKVLGTYGYVYKNIHIYVRLVNCSRKSFAKYILRKYVGECEYLL